MKQGQWLKTRKHLLDTVKNQVMARLGGEPRSLKNYSKKLALEFEKTWRLSEVSEMMERAEASDLLFLGDFHAYYQSQRAHLRILRSMDLTQSLVFFECLKEDDAQAIDLFWADEISESEFLTLVQWESSWGFAWEHYRDLFLHLKERQVLVRGLSAGDFFDLRLKARDRKMAQIIEKELLVHPSRKVVVIAGENHLHKKHLPLEVSLRSSLKFKAPMVIFQDNEILYFRTHKKLKSFGPTVLRRGDSFCWNASPPWVKWQSYLIHLEKTSDQELEDEDLDYEDHIKAFVQWMVQDLDLSVSFNSLEVYTPKTAKGLRTDIPQEIFKELIFSDRSFLLSPQGKIYLSRPSVNHASSVAGQYIHAQMSQRKKIYYNLPKDLERRLWIETVGFFFSKWMNPARKTESFEDLKIRLDSLKERGTSTQTMRLVSEIFVLGQRMKAGRKTRSLQGLTKGAHPLAQFEACRYLGRIFGRALFEAALSHRVSR
ncbi:MAG TPA: hypothetical protein DCL41_07335, partial [Bdellovibrionales bacterium]|nr:hypothetical protein [Bdellovibrionales bacterium]